MVTMMNDDGDGDDNDEPSPLFLKIILFVVISSSFCKSGTIYKSFYRSAQALELSLESSFLSIMQMNTETKAIGVYHILGKQI